MLSPRTWILVKQIEARSRSCKDAQAYRHVAVVIDITYTSTGSIAYITTADDNSGRQIATEKRLFPSDTTGLRWPNNFITFPGFTGIYSNPVTGGSGGKPSVALVVSPVTN